MSHLTPPQDRSYDPLHLADKKNEAERAGFPMSQQGGGRAALPTALWILALPSRTTWDFLLPSPQAIVGLSVHLTITMAGVFQI